MKPPWEQFPDNPRGSLFWRIGQGETYWMSYYMWFRNLSEEDRDQYVAEHPEPEGWEDTYSNILE
jgi:hypothetical protein